MVMERPKQESRSPLASREFLYRRNRIGKSKVSDGSLNLPKQVSENYNIQPGDILEWYPCQTDFPDEKETEILAILIVRHSRKKEEKDK